jgi:hypothetical protein
MNGFDVDADQLRSHANTIASIADQLSGAASQAPDRVADGALGSFSQFLTAGLSGAAGQSVTAIGGVSAAVDTLSIGIRRAAETYQHTDEHSANHLVQESQR